MPMTMMPAAMPIISHKLIPSSPGLAGGAEGMGCAVGGTVGVSVIADSVTVVSAGTSVGVACFSDGSSGVSDGAGGTSDDWDEVSLTKNVPDIPLTSTA